MTSIDGQFVTLSPLPLWSKKLIGHNHQHILHPACGQFSYHYHTSPSSLPHRAPITIIQTRSSLSKASSLIHNPETVRTKNKQNKHIFSTSVVCHRRGPQLLFVEVQDAPASIIKLPIHRSGEGHREDKRDELGICGFVLRLV